MKLYVFNIHFVLFSSKNSYESHYTSRMNKQLQNDLTKLKINEFIIFIIPYFQRSILHTNVYIHPTFFGLWIMFICACSFCVWIHVVMTCQLFSRTSLLCDLYKPCSMFYVFASCTHNLYSISIRLKGIILPIDMLSFIDMKKIESRMEHLFNCPLKCITAT